MERPQIDFDSLARDLLGRARELLPSWLPGGKFRGHEFICGNLRGDPGESLSVNINTGKWADFADESARGGDLIALYAAIHGLKQAEAAKELGGEVARLPPAKGPPKGAEPKPGEKWTPLVPVPDGAPAPRNRRMVEVNGQWVAADFVARWAYRDAQGQLLGYDVRFRKPDGSKEVVTQTYCRNAEGKADWKWKAFPEPRPLYGLELLAQRPDAPVMLGEGCKTVEAQRELAGHVYVACGWPGGAQADAKVDWSPLHGRQVLLWPDADAGGIEGMRRIAERLAPHCPEVKILDVAGQPDGWDAADAFGEGWTWPQLLEWAKPRAKVYEPAPAPAPPKVVDLDARRKAKQSPAEKLPQFASQYAMWEQLGLVLSNNGAPIPNLDNVMRVLEGWPEFKGALWFDEFSDRILTTWRSGDRVGAREWSDGDTLALTVWLQRDIGIRRIGDETVGKAVRACAARDTRNAPRDWLDLLEWDGVERLPQFFPDAVGAEDNEYTRAVGQNLFVAMVARVYRPGCMMRHVVCLEGPQDLGKSSVLNAIGGDWYMEVAERVDSPEFFLVIQGKLLCEIAEFDSFSKAETTRIKQVISNRSDRFRAKYDRNAQDHPRKCVFVVTTNDRRYLRDATGGSRFWPIRCRELNLAMILDNRAQYFAEAVHKFKAGATWWEVPKEKAVEEQEARRQIDAWEEHLGEWLVGKTETTSKEILSDALRIDPGRQEHKHTIRLSGVMQKLGWFQLTAWRSGRSTRVWKRVSEEGVEPAAE